MAKYKNIYGEIYTFTKQGIDKILMEGNFEFNRVGGEPDDIEYINPSGGPFIKKGQMLSHIIHDIDFNVIVETIERVDNGYIINIRENDVNPDDFSYLEDGNYIGSLTMPKEKSDHWKQKNEKPRSYLIKRSNSFRDLKKNNSQKKGYFEITISKHKRNPPSHKLKMNDIIYVAETGGGIYAKGEVIKSGKVETITSVEKLLEFSKSFNDDQYWLSKIREFSRKLSSDKNYKLRLHEYFINQKILDRTIPYNGQLEKYDASINRGMAGIFLKLRKEDVEYLKEPDYSLKSITALSPEIPGNLRLKLYSLFNKKYSISHLIDIDHFVPKSLGGPGNIVENLVPIGFSLNRYKNDSIPRCLFEIASSDAFKSNFTDIQKEILKISKLEDQFIRTNNYPGAKDIARKITSIVNDWQDINQIKSFYLTVNEKFNPSYGKIIREMNIALY